METDYERTVTNREFEQAVKDFLIFKMVGIREADDVEPETVEAADTATENVVKGDDQ